MKGFLTFMLVVLVLSIIAVCPILTIAALNALFSLSIPINLTTYAAAFWLSALVYGSTR